MAGDEAAGFIKVSMAMDVGVDAPMAEFNADFAVNTVPSAVVKLAVGVNGRGEHSQAAAAVQAINDTRTPIEISSMLEGSEGDEGTIFSGYVTAAALDAAAGQSVGILLYCEHKIANLDAGTKLSHFFHAESASDMWNVVSGNASGISGNASMDGGIYQKLAHGNPQGDIWGNFMKPIFAYLCESGGDRFKLTEFASAGAGTNHMALQALDLVNSGDGAMPAAVKSSNSALAKVLAKAIPDHIMQPASGQSFWETMVNFGALWKLACLPRCEDVLYVPFLEAANSVHAEISLHDYFYSSGLQNIARTPVRGVALFSDSGNAHGYGASNAHVAGLADMVQFGGDGTGQMVCLRVPSCFTDLGSTTTVAALCPAAKTPLSHMSNPTVPQAPLAADFINEAYAFGGSALDMIAKALLTTYRYKDRTVQIIGKWRTDICPGSSVAVELLTGEQGQSAWFYGCVTAVSYNVTADQPFICTKLTIGFLRSAGEQNSSPLVTDSHPIYDSTFIGAGMRG